MTPKERRSKETNRMEWAVLYDEDPGAEAAGWPDLGATSTTDPVGQPAHLLSWAGLLGLLLLVAAYAIGTVAEGSPHIPPPTTVPALLSVDRLAANAFRSTLTEHLRIYAGGSDVALVESNAGELAQRQAEVYGKVGLPQNDSSGAPDGRLPIHVEGSQPAEWDGESGRIVLPSPLLWAKSVPVEQTVILRQNWSVALGDGAVHEAGQYYQIPDGWRPLIDGLRLWLLWDGDGPP